LAKNNTNKKDEIYLSIRKKIISHELKPGQPLREEALASKYGVSRTPIREVLRRLESDGLVEIIPYKGIFVTELTLADIREILDIRLALESIAARRAAINIEDEEIERLKDLADKFETAAKENDIELSFQADDRLHKIILIIADNNRLKEYLNKLLSQIYRIRFLSGNTPGRLDESSQEHQDIINALIDRDPDSAEKMMKKHLRNTEELLLGQNMMESKLAQLTDIMIDGEQ